MNYWVKERLESFEKAFNPNYCRSIEAVVELIVSSFQKGNTLLVCGNGGSSADAQHIAAEFVGRFNYDRAGLPAIALGTNPATLSAWSNDYEFETIFAREIESFGKQGDILWVLSTSGRSRNIIHALKTAKEKGLTTIGMAGNNGGMISSLTDYPLFVSEKNTPYVQEIHIMTYHRICEEVEAQLFAKQTLQSVAV